MAMSMILIIIIGGLVVFGLFALIAVFFLQDKK